MAEIVWESDAQSSGFTVMSNGMVWPDDWPGTLVEAQFTSARGDGADLDRDPDMVPSGPGRVIFTPQVRTVGYDGEHGKRIVSLHPFEAVVGDDGYLYTPDEYGQPGIRGIVLPSNNSDVVDEHDWTWRVTFDIPDTTIRPTHIPTPRDHSVDIKDYLDSDANYGVRVVVDTVSARDAQQAASEAVEARDLVLPARDQTLAARDQTLAHGITVDTSVGTRVFVGNTMIYGDTGWRDVTGLLSTAYLDMNPEATAQIRRENSIVAINIYQGRNATADGFVPGILYMPDGFWAHSRTRTWGSTGIDMSSGRDAAGQGSIYLGGHNYVSTFAAPNKRLAFTLWYFADSVWPSILPGSPA